MRLSKYLASCGIASRRKAEEIILSGQVKVNGETIKEMGIKIDPIKDKVSVYDEVIKAENKVYFVLNKPKGYTTTVSDPHAKYTVLDLIKTKKRIFPVGRLDKDTTGLLILTNDGELADKLTHPKYEKEKEYEFVVSSKLSTANIRKLEKGMILEEKMTAPTKVKKISVKKSKHTYSITLKEGRKRQIRIMLEKIGYPVLELKRVRVGDLNLDSLREGKYRKLSSKEIQSKFD